MSQLTIWPKEESQIKIDKPEYISNSTYRNNEELKYYGSDLNKFIGTKLPRIMTTINIDIAQQKISKKVLRVTESKHTKEILKDKQKKLLIELSRIFKHAMATGYPAILEVGVIRADYPYNELIYEDYIKNETVTITGIENVFKFLTIYDENSIKDSIELKKYLNKNNT